MKTFKELKKYFKDAGKRASACTSEYHRVLQSKTKSELLAVIKDNFRWCFENGCVSPDILDWFGQDVVENAGIYYKGVVPEIKDKTGVVLAFDAVVERLSDNAVVKKMYDNAVVQEMLASSVIKEMYDNTVVGEMWGNAVVGKMLDNAVVRKMLSSAVVQRMFDNAIVENMYGNAVVQEMWDDAVVKEMYGNAVAINTEQNKIFVAREFDIIIKNK